MAVDPRKPDLDELYEELSKFAPREAVSEMAELADRLKELARAPQKAGSADVDLDSIWSRVEAQLEEG